MQIQELLDQAREGMGAKRVYGEPYEKNGLTVIPAAAVRGGAGGGGEVGESGEGKGVGGGFGLAARPTGAWVIEGDKVEWKPVVDVNKIVLGAELVAFAAVLRLFRPKTLHVLPASLLERVPKVRLAVPPFRRHRRSRWARVRAGVPFV